MSEQTSRSSSPVEAPDPEAAKPVFAPYNPPAGGWGALRAVVKALREQNVILKGSEALLSVNQPEGFDCPGCAWPDPRHTSSFEFCENGAKAVANELTKRRVTREFFATHAVRELEEESDYLLEEHGRLTEPMRYDATTDHYVPIDWNDAFAMIGSELNALDSPNGAEFYTSGRTSNEAAFMYQLFARRFGTNNFPDCSNMCHEPTSVGLPESIGIGKGTVVLDDFAHAEAIFIIGQNPGTQPANADGAASGIAPRRTDHCVQPLARACARAVCGAPGSDRDGDLQRDEDCQRVLSGPKRRRCCCPQRGDEAGAGGA
jgi:anaerobic selenocysteine-containing dehydrogenase